MEHPFADLIGLFFDYINEGQSLCRLKVREEFYNPQNVVHGGVLYSLADTGMGGALYPTLNKDEFCATIEITICYFKPVTSGVLECKSTLINKGKTVASLESEIKNNAKLVAKAYGSFSIFKPKIK